jgi:hypothetical protein
MGEADTLALYEYPFYLLGLNTPFQRGIATFGTVTGLILYSQPSFCFDEKGNALDWRLTNKDPVGTTWVPWWLPGVTLSFLTSFYI